MKNQIFFTTPDKSVKSEKTLGAKFPFTGLSYEPENHLSPALSYRGEHLPPAPSNRREHLPPAPSNRGGVGGGISFGSGGEEMWMKTNLIPTTFKRECKDEPRSSSTSLFGMELWGGVLRRGLGGGVFRAFALSCLLFLLISTLSHAQLDWTGTQTLTGGQVITHFFSKYNDNGQPVYLVCYICHTPKLEK